MYVYPFSSLYAPLDIYTGICSPIVPLKCMSFKSNPWGSKKFFLNYWVFQLCYFCSHSLLLNCQTEISCGYLFLSNHLRNGSSDMKVCVKISNKQSMLEQPYRCFVLLWEIPVIIHQNKIFPYVYEKDTTSQIKTSTVIWWS